MAKQTWVNVNGTWRKVKDVWVKVNGIWKNNVMPKGVVQGNWKEFMSYKAEFIVVRRENGQIGKYNLDGNHLKTFSSGLTLAGGLDTGKDGTIFVSYAQEKKLNILDSEGNLIRTHSLRSSSDNRVSVNNKGEYLIYIDTAVKPYRIYDSKGNELRYSGRLGILDNDGYVYDVVETRLYKYYGEDKIYEINSSELDYGYVGGFVIDDSYIYVISGGRFKRFRKSDGSYVGQSEGFGVYDYSSNYNIDMDENYVYIDATYKRTTSIDSKLYRFTKTGTKLIETTFSSSIFSDDFYAYKGAVYINDYSWLRKYIVENSTFVPVFNISISYSHVTFDYCFSVAPGRFHTRQ